MSHGSAEQDNAEAALTTGSERQEDAAQSAGWRETDDRRSMYPQSHNEARNGYTGAPDNIRYSDGADGSGGREGHDGGSHDTAGRGRDDARHDGEEPNGGHGVGGMLLVGKAEMSVGERTENDSRLT